MTTICRPRVVISHRPFAETLALLEPHAEVIHNNTDASWPTPILRAQARDAVALMAFMPDTLKAADLVHFPKLRIVAGALKGYDNFDVDFLAEQGVWVTNVPDLLTDPTADLGVALLLALARQLLPADAHVRSGRFAAWQPLFYGQGIAGKTVGIIGMGAVGCALARRLAPFGATILYYDHKPRPLADDATMAARPADLATVIAAADYLFPLTHLYAQTYHQIDAARLASMKASAFIINIGRGSLVDERAVADALAAGRLAGYGADVFEMEDWAIEKRPRQIDPRLLEMRDKTVFSPHIGSAVSDIRQQIEHQAALNIVDYLTGTRPRGAVREIATLSADAERQASGQIHVGVSGGL